MRWVVFGALLAGTLSAQHNYTPADVEDGGKLFRSNCVNCHGADGDQVQGVDLAHGKFRRATTDDQLVEIIRKGIAGTPMPPGNYTEFQASTIVAYLRSLAEVGRGSGIAGDAARGKQIFNTKGACTACHRVLGTGSRVAPDLSDIGALRRPAELERSITEPNAEVLPQSRYVRVVTREGQTFTGRILNIDSFTIQMVDSKEKLMTFAKTNLKEYGFVASSPMPSYKGKLNGQEIADVVNYLGTLKGIEVQ